MKILLLSACYYSWPSIATVRPAKITKYLAQKYHCEVTVYRQKPIQQNSDYKYPYEHQIVDVQNFYNKPIQIVILFLLRIYDKLMRYRKRLRRKLGLDLDKSCIFDPAERLLYILCHHIIEGRNRADWIRNDVLNSGIQYDVILSTYGPFYPTIAAQMIKKDQPNALWISDYRDTVIYKHCPKILRPYHRKFVSRYSAGADVITAVSTGMMEKLYIDRAKLNLQGVYALPNGYDSDEILDIPPQTAIPQKLVFTYCGTLFKDREDFSPVFAAVRSLIQKGDLDEGKILFRYAGRKTGPDFIQQAKKYDLDHTVVDMGFVEKNISMTLQKQSDILLLASWNNKNAQGILTGKFYEYMMINKPIIAAITGDLPNSTMKKMIQEMKLGFCYEEANHEQDYPLLEEYILTQYRRKTAGQELTHEPIAALVSRFDYPNLVDSWYEVINGRIPAELGV